MIVYRDLKNIEIERPVATIGIFDGVHLAHQAIIGKLKEKAAEMLKMYAPIFKGGKYRASASRILKGDLLGYFDYDRNNPNLKNDQIPHDQLRVLRGLRVFGSWTNNYDLHRKNTMDVLVDENGKKKLKHYLLDFGSSFGSAAYRPKVPAIGFENMID